MRKTYEVLSQRLRVHFWMDNKVLVSGMINKEIIVNDFIRKDKNMETGILLSIKDLYQHTSNSLKKMKGQVFIERNKVFSSRTDAESGRSSYFPTKKVDIEFFEKGHKVHAILDDDSILETVVEEFDVLIKKEKVKVVYYVKDTNNKLIQVKNVFKSKTEANEAVIKRTLNSMN